MICTFMYVLFMLIHACGMNCNQSLTVLITHGQPCDTSCKHYTVAKKGLFPLRICQVIRVCLKFELVLK